MNWTNTISVLVVLSFKGTDTYSWFVNEVKWLRFSSSLPYWRRDFCKLPLNTPNLKGLGGGGGGWVGCLIWVFWTLLTFQFICLMEPCLPGSAAGRWLVQRRTHDMFVEPDALRRAFKRHQDERLICGSVMGTGPYLGSVSDFVIVLSGS